MRIGTIICKKTPFWIASSEARRVANEATSSGAMNRPTANNVRARLWPSAWRTADALHKSATLHALPLTQQTLYIRLFSFFVWCFVQHMMFDSIRFACARRTIGMQKIHFWCTQVRRCIVFWVVNIDVYPRCRCVRCAQECCSTKNH